MGPVGLAEDDEVLAHDAQALLRLLHRQLRGRTQGLPIAPQKFAARRARTHARQPLVLLLGQHRTILPFPSFLYVALRCQCRRGARSIDAGPSTGTDASMHREETADGSAWVDRDGPHR